MSLFNDRKMEAVGKQRKRKERERKMELLKLPLQNDSNILLVNTLTTIFALIDVMQFFSSIYFDYRFFDGNSNERHWVRSLYYLIEI